MNLRIQSKAAVMLFLIVTAIRATPTAIADPPVDGLTCIPSTCSPDTLSGRTFSEVEAECQEFHLNGDPVHPTLNYTGNVINCTIPNGPYGNPDQCEIICEVFDGSGDSGSVGADGGTDAGPGDDGGDGGGGFDGGGF